MSVFINKKLVEELIEGYWAVEPNEKWQCEHISENIKNCKKGKSLFIAMNNDTWQMGASNKDYMNCSDTRDLLPVNYENVHGIICQRKIDCLPDSVPQYIVKDSFDFVKTIPKLLLNTLDINYEETSTKEVVCFYHDNNLLYEKNIQQKIDYGIGGLILLNLALKKYIKGEVKIDQTYTVSSIVDREANRAKNLDFKIGEKSNFLELIQLVYLTQSSIAILALAELLYGSTSNAINEIRLYAKNIGINEKLILNITGRDYNEKKQSTYLSDLILVLNKLFNLPLKARNLISNKMIVFKNKVIEIPFKGWDSKYADLMLFIGPKERRFYFSCKFNDNYNEIGIFYNLLADHRLVYLLPSLKSNQYRDLDKINLRAKTKFINILGDTYFGESYTKLRKKRGIIDALQKHGYDYSFEKIKTFFKEDDINIANFEAVFNKSESSSLDGIKGFILGADSNKSITALKKHNFNNLVLANNHAKDYGSESLNFMLDDFNESDINYIGAGRNEKESLKFFEIKTEEKTYAIFNGYWHRNTANEIYEFYALGSNSGVSSLEGMMLDQIESYKKNNPYSKVIVIAHWGVDFKSIHAYQRSTAKLLTDIGVDIIIGHGPHTIQPIEYINGKPIIYSIGNGVFNSNGEYSKHNALPFGLIAKINIEQDTLRLYPIFTNNLECFWQPFPISNQLLEIYAGRLNNNFKIDDFKIDENLNYYTELGF